MKIWFAVFSGLTALLSGTAAGAAARPCPAERATYTLKPDPAYTARFIRSRHHAGQASDLYLQVRTPKRTLWFTMGVSNGYGRIHLHPVGDPYRGGPDGPNHLLGPSAEVDPEVALWEPRSALYPMRRDLTVEDDPPSKGDPAPYALFMPELGTAMWYELGSLTEGAGLERESMPRGVFLRTGCAKTAPPPAFP